MKKRVLRVCLGIIAGIVLTGVFVELACRIPTSPSANVADACGPSYIHRFRPNLFIQTGQLWIRYPCIVHISRASTPCGNDTTTFTEVQGGHFVTHTYFDVDPNPPHGFTDTLVQFVKDRRAEFYSEFGLRDPN